MKLKEACALLFASGTKLPERKVDPEKKLALEKRQIERELRQQGYSVKQAKKEVARRYEKK
ncbi:MAG: hypothetical protein JXA04_10680 [Gammaproteobacteria bacterium]|nr:hypothetical protein [Gammaproteobacteria bacterium]